MSQQYNDYLTGHVANVTKAYLWLSQNMPEIIEAKGYDEGLLISGHIVCSHDDSKRDQEEYPAYDAYFYGNNRSFEVKQAFDKAWLHHIHHNQHHWQHWVLYGDDAGFGVNGVKALEMPYHCVVEMICDWWSFSWAKDDLYELFNWYDEHKNRMLLHPKTLKTVESILEKIRAKLSEGVGDGTKT